MKFLALATQLAIVLTAVLLSTSVHAAAPSVPSAIDRFVAKIFPQASHYHWIVNNTQTETDQEMIVDINTFVTNNDKDHSLTESRFLLLVLNGEVLAAQKIPLGANVDCGKDKDTEI